MNKNYILITRVRRIVIRVLDSEFGECNRLKYDERMMDLLINTILRDPDLLKGAKIYWQK